MTSAPNMRLQLKNNWVQPNGQLRDMVARVSF
jgi:hypothetical protein